MIPDSKKTKGLFSLHIILYKLRSRAREAGQPELERALDYLEIIPEMFVSARDETESLRQVLVEVAALLNWSHILESFDDPGPCDWDIDWSKNSAENDSGSSR